MSPSPAHPDQKRYNLSRRFALAALALITLIALTVGVLLDRFITQRLLWQEAALTREFVQSLVQVEKSLQRFLADPARGLDAETETAFMHIAALPDMLRANVYDPGRRLIWSSDKAMIGRSFGPNRELDNALAGDVVTKSIERARPEQGKAEHVNLQAAKPAFVEIYVPVLAENGGRVHAVIEFYKNPRALISSLNELRTYIVAGAAASAALLFAALFGLVRRADMTIRRQQRELVDKETLAVIGEMSAAVAHGIRNPLASIRSSAELIQDGDLPQAHDAAADIVAQSDRLEAWVRELLAYTRPLDESVSSVPLQPLVARCLGEFEREMQRRGIRSQQHWAADIPAVRGDTLLLGQVLSSLLANAVEALEQGGQVTVRGEWQRGDKAVRLSVEDSGPGMSEQQLLRAGKPFHTTKPRGLGVGLALARRVVERFGGQLDIDSEPGRGTAVRLRLQIA